MLKPVTLAPQEKPDTPLMDFRHIKAMSSGEGIAFVYNAVQKRTKSGKPFVTLHLRDVNGLTAPGYIFDLASPILSGRELKEVTNQFVKVVWDENYLNNIGLTFILRDVQLITNPSIDMRISFVGDIENVVGKEKELTDFISKAVGKLVMLPRALSIHSSPAYYGGKCGGLLEHYWRMHNILKSYTYLKPEEYRVLIGTFASYIFTHSAYQQADESQQADVSTMLRLTEKLSTIMQGLKLPQGTEEVISMFFGMEPMNIYVRTIRATAELVQRIEDEFSLYRTIPLTQKGDAGYGEIKRYEAEGI